MRIRFLSLALASLACSPLSGATFTVNDTVDAPDAVDNGICATAGGKCSLRAAVREANQAAGSTVIVPAGSYDLTLGELHIQAAMTIQGAGAGVTFLNGTATTRVLTSSPATGVTVSGVTLQNGHTTQNGGCVIGSLTITKSVLTGCTAEYGGCLLNAGFTTLDEVVMHGCHASASGGGIATYFANSAFYSLVVRRSTIRDNFADGGNGGGIHVGQGSADIGASTISGNTASQNGGGIYFLEAPDANAQARLVNVTVDGNNAVGEGGGIYVANGQMNAYSTTVTRNQVVSVGPLAGGLHRASGVLNFRGGAFSGNRRATEPRLSDCGGAMSTFGRSVIGAVRAGCTVAVGSGVLVQNVQTLDADPALLGPLAANGGPTLTAFPLGVFLLDSYQAADCVDHQAPLVLDQRGVKRPLGANCDIGAVEVEPKGDANGDGTVTVTDVFHLVNYLFAGGPAPYGRANVNGDSSISVLDVFYLVNFLFAAGPPPV
jgi:CSLREA domain-containing protein